MSGTLRATDYPPHWAALRAQVLTRAQACCECVGECGSSHPLQCTGRPRCDAPNHALIIRDPLQPALWWREEDAPLYLRDAYHSRRKTLVRIVLTIAHLCQDSRCANLEHLRAMCQRCHLVYDHAQHRRNASATRQRQKELAGQLSFLEGRTRDPAQGDLFDQVSPLRELLATPPSDARQVRMFDDGGVQIDGATGEVVE